MEGTSIPNSFDDIKALTNQIQKCFLSRVSEDRKWLLLERYFSDILLKKKFDKTVATSYSALLSTLLDVLQPCLFTEKWQEALFEKNFLQGIHHQAFLILVKRLDQSSSYVEQKIISLLVKFIQGSSFESLFVYQCLSRGDWNLKYVSMSNIWDDLIGALVSLPERIANKTSGKFRKLFSTTSFIPLLLSTIFKALSVIHDRLQETEVSHQQECSVEFLSKLTGKICTVGHADIVAKKFSKEMVKLAKTDFIWRRLSQNFISKIPASALDSFIINLLLQVPWYGNVEWILGNEGIRNEKIKYIMSIKLLFYRPFKQVIILQNAIGYFASCPSRVSQFFNILNLLLDSWTDQRALKHQSLEHKMYIALALMVCAGWLRHLKLESENKEHIKKVLEGTHIRLQSSVETVRSLGLIVGHHMIKSIDPDCESLKLEECVDINLANRLKQGMEIPSNPDNTLIGSEDLTCFEEVELENKKEDKMEEGKNEVAFAEEFESDDDLPSYDMSHDVSQSERKRPLYLRDCMTGLMDQDVEWAEKCLRHTEELIKANPYAVNEVAEEMAKIVLHLGNNLSIPDFVALRLRTLITLTTECPVKVSSYLISQFTEREYNIRQRLDILEVLAASSAVLSTTSLRDSETEAVSLNRNSEGKDAEWQIILHERLEAKTTRYTKAQKPVSKENKFSAVCGNFFYPLLNSYEMSSKIMKLHEQDSYVLGRFIYTLGIIMHYSANTIQCGQMGVTLLQFLTTLRLHKDEFVRSSIIFAVTATFTAIPPSVLFSTDLLLQDVYDTFEWLQNVAENDPDSSCMEKALHALSIFRSVAAEDSVISQLKKLIL